MIEKSMTAKDIRKEVSPMVIWMADATIREARRALTDNTGWPRVQRHDYNLPEVEMAGEILYRMIETYPAAIKSALCNMPAEYDGVYDRPGRNYFDEFMHQLELYFVKVQKFNPILKLRESDWILERL